MTKLAYILAASHSGSTLLAMMLNGHPDICTAGELKLTHLGDVERYRCSCGVLIRQCAFWGGVIGALRERGVDLDLAQAGTSYRGVSSAYTRRLLRPLHRGPLLEAIRDAALACSATWRQSRPRIDARNSALVAALRDASGAQVIVDSSKVALRLKYHLRNPELDVRVIRLIRDGRGVALTYMDPAGFADARDPRLREGGCGGDRHNERQSMQDAARQWRRSNEEAEAVLRGLSPAQCIELRYEDLCAHPQHTMQRVSEFLGVDPQRWQRDFRSADHHVIGNGMRLDSGSDIALDERWRGVLGAGELSIFDAIAGEMTKRYGYA